MENATSDQSKPNASDSWFYISVILLLCLAFSQVTRQMEVRKEKRLKKLKKLTKMSQTLEKPTRPVKSQ